MDNGAETRRHLDSAPYPAVPRGRPTAARTAAIDAAIRAAALERFLAVGYDAASMDAIAAAAGVSKGTLYARHDSKESLFRSVLEAQLEHVSRLAGAQDHLLPDDMALRLRHHGRTLMEVFGWSEFRQVSALVDSAALTFPDMAGVWQDMATARYIAFLSADMARHARLPQGASADWDFLANLFLHAISGWHQHHSVRRTVNKDEARAYCDKVIASIEATLAVSCGGQNPEPG